MPLLSVITAAYAPTADYLQATAESVASLDIPAGWEVEWVVQEDGAEPRLESQIRRFDFVRYAASRRQFGTARTRNLALTRASGVLLQALDQDDVLLPGLLTTLIPLFERYPIHWAIGQADDLLPDGTRRPYPSPIPFGLYEPGVINDFAEKDGGNWPIHAAALMMRTASVRALGGWTGIPFDDELAAFAALSQAAPGWYDEQLTWLYRHHPKQLHRTRESEEMSAAGRRVALQRARAVAATGLRFADASAAGFAATDGDVYVGPVAKDTSLPVSVGVTTATAEDRNPRSS
jgi:glycosyltransferase involved in cell wall biosynthesis